MPKMKSYFLSRQTRKTSRIVEFLVCLFSPCAVSRDAALKNLWKKGMDVAFLEERISKTKALIVIYEDAAAALVGGVQSFTLDTGQTREVVMKKDEARINRTITSLYNRCGTLEARLNGGDVLGVPAW